MIVLENWVLEPSVLKVIDTISLTFTIPSPCGIILHPKVLSMYEKVHVFLLQLRCMSKIVNDCWSASKQILRCASSSDATSIGLFLYEQQQWIQNFQGYVSTQVSQIVGKQGGFHM